MYAAVILFLLALCIVFHARNAMHALHGSPNPVLQVVLIVALALPMVTVVPNGSDGLALRLDPIAAGVGAIVYGLALLTLLIAAAVFSVRRSAPAKPALWIAGAVICTLNIPWALMAASELQGRW